MMHCLYIYLKNTCIPYCVCTYIQICPRGPLFEFDVRKIESIDHLCITIASQVPSKIYIYILNKQCRTVNFVDLDLL